MPDLSTFNATTGLFLACSLVATSPGWVQADSNIERVQAESWKTFTAVQSANAGMRLYRDEMVKPTPRPKPPFTNFVTHDYVLAKITERLVEVKADVPTLKKAWGEMSAGEVKDCLSIFLLMRGDAGGREPVEKIVPDRSRAPRLRELAVRALGQDALKKEDPSIGRLLAQVIREDVQGVFALREAAVGAENRAGSAAGTSSAGKGKKKAAKGTPLPGGAAGSGTQKKEVVMLYPVRRAAAEIIKTMKKRGMLLESYVTVTAEQARYELPLPIQPRELKKPAGQ